MRTMEISFRDEDDVRWIDAIKFAFNKIVNIAMLDGHEDAAGNFEHFHQENDQYSTLHPGKTVVCNRMR